MNCNPIGIFDSGHGGLTVLDACVKLLPDENYAYVSDSRGSWGNLSERQIYWRALSCVTLLAEKKCKIVVAACNTATGVGIDGLRAAAQVPIVGIEPAVKPAAAAAFGRITVFCTAATARQRNLQTLINKYGQNVKVVALPDLADLIEKNFHSLINLRPEVKLIAEQNPSDAAVLGCTHYVFLRPFFKEFYGEGRVFDGNGGVARRVKSVLSDSDLLNGSGGRINFYKI